MSFVIFSVALPRSELYSVMRLAFTWLPSYPSQIKYSAGSFNCGYGIYFPYGRINIYPSCPHFAIICTMPRECPNGSKFTAVVGFTPNFSRKYISPSRIWRTIPSPQGIRQSGCKNQPPIICHLPSFTSSLISSNNAGAYFSVYLYNVTSLWQKM